MFLKVRNVPLHVQYMVCSKQFWLSLIYSSVLCLLIVSSISTISQGPPQNFKAHVTFVMFALIHSIEG